MKALVYDNERDAKAVSADALKQRKRGRVNPEDVSAYLWVVRETVDGKFAVMVGDDRDEIGDYPAVTYAETTYDEDGTEVATEYTAPKTSVTELTNEAFPPTQ